MSKRWQEIERLFQAAIRLHPAERTTYLEDQCGNDLSLKNEVEALVFSDNQAEAENFLNSPTSSIFNTPVDRLAQLVGSVLDQKYRIDQQLGQGGMGAVFLATHMGTKRAVALKVIAPQFMANEEFVERFKREAEAAGRLRHPNVVNVTDFGFAQIGSDRLAYLVMEYLNGCTLGDMLKERGKLELGLVLDIVEQVCLAVSEAHCQGIIHRDLKPDNIWLEPNGRNGFNVKVLDFGLAKLRDVNGPDLPIVDTSDTVAAYHRTPIWQSQPAWQSQIEQDVSTQIQAKVQANIQTKLQSSQDQSPVFGEERTWVDKDKTKIANRGATGGEIDTRTVPEWLTRIGMVMGTPLYMSPEQCRGDLLDTRADIYSLGVIVYQMLAGETPFTGDTHLLILKHTDMPPPSLREKRKDLPKSVAAVVMSALAKNISDRPQTANAFATALRANAEGEVPLMRQALGIYRKNFSAFMRVSIPIYLTAMAISFLPLALLLRNKLDAMQSSYAHLLQNGGYWLFAFLIISLANSIDTGACALIVNKLYMSRSEKTSSNSTISMLKMHLPSLIATALKSSLTSWLRLLKLIVPGVKSYLDLSLAAPAVVIENYHGQAALNRSRELTNRLRALVNAIQLRDFFTAAMTPLAFIVTLVLGGLLFDMFYDFLGQRNMYPSIPPNSLPISLQFFSFALPTLLLLLLHPIVAIANSLVYFKTRQVGGEALDETLIKNLEPIERSGSPKPSRRRSYALIFLMLLALVKVVAIKQELLFWVLSHDRSTALKSLIYIGDDITAKNNQSETPLLMAVKYDHRKSVITLLNAGVDVNVKNKLGQNALALAVTFERDEFINALLQSGADVNSRDQVCQCTPLMFAASHGSYSTVKELLVAGADINAKSDFGFTALHWSVATGWHRGEVVKVLLAAGAEANAKDKYGRTALMEAARWGFTYVIQPLIDAGTDVNARDTEEETALSQAAKSGNDDIVRILKAAGATTSSQEALICQAAEGDTASVKLAISLHADLDAKDKNGINALMYAANNGHVETVQALIDAGANVNASDKRGETALMKAAFYRHANVVQKLISAGADTNAKDKDGYTVLDKAINSSNFKNQFISPAETVKVLLDAGVSVKSSDWALGEAASLHDINTLKILIAADGNPNAKNLRGKTPLAVAEDNGYISIVNLLKEHGAQ